MKTKRQLKKLHGKKIVMKALKKTDNGDNKQETQ